MKLTQRSGFVRSGLLFLLLVVVVAVLYLSRRRSVDLDLAEAGKAVAGDLEQAAETVRETSEGAFLTAKVKTALALSKSAPAMDVDVDSDGGRVTLTGTVPSNESRVAILEVARRISDPAPDPALWGTFHAAGAGTATWHDFASEIVDAAAQRGAARVPVQPISTADYPSVAARPANSMLDCRKFQSAFGAGLPPWQQGVEACVGALLDS